MKNGSVCCGSASSMILLFFHPASSFCSLNTMYYFFSSIVHVSLLLCPPVSHPASRSIMLVLWIVAFCMVSMWHAWHVSLLALSLAWHMATITQWAGNTIPSAVVSHPVVHISCSCLPPAGSNLLLPPTP